MALNSSVHTGSSGGDNDIRSPAGLICLVAFTPFGKSMYFLSHEHEVTCCVVFFPFSAVVPHITDAIQEWVMNQAKVSVDSNKEDPQICVIEASMELFFISYCLTGSLSIQFSFTLPSLVW